MGEAYVYDHIRSPRGRGRTQGALHEVPPVRLAADVLSALAARNELDTRRIDDATLGCVTAVGEQGANIARLAVLMAGWSQDVPGQTLNRFCASGLAAVNIAAAQVMSGQCDLTVGGGVESMSRVPMLSDGGAWAIDPSVAWQTQFIPQGISADLIASKYGYRREDCDAFALESQRRAGVAIQEGRFKGSIAPIYDEIGRLLLDRDEHPRPDTTMEGLGQLRPSFAQMGAQAGFDVVALQKYPEVETLEHVHHAGNSSGIVDGAAAMLIGSREIGESLGLKPRAKIRAFASVGTEPTIMLTGPSFAVEKALQRAGMTVDDIDIWEVNEAFASVVLRFMEALAVPHERVNMSGGSIALGHPLGATGAMILGTAIDEMERQNKSTCCATLCVGAGMGTATILERV